MTERTIPSGDVMQGEVELPNPAPGRARRGHHPGAALAVIASCYLMIMLDSSIVNIALPNIQRGLHFSPTGLSWVLNAYTLAFGGLLLLGGRMGDILGRRRCFIAGIAVFTLASALAGAATTSWWILAARALQGIGAAAASPSALALIATNFKEGTERNRALSIYSTVAIGGGSAGLVLGGILTDWTSWRWIFFINLPIGAAVMLLAPLFIHESERRPGRFDLAGAATSTVGMTAFVYAFIRAGSNGWSDVGTLGAFAVAAVVMAGYVIVELRAAQPITPLRLLTDRNRAGAYVNMLLLTGAMFGVFYFLTQFIQEVRDFSPLTAGLAFLPMTVTVAFCVRGIVPRLLPRFGPKRLMTTGLVLVVGGLVWLSQISATTGYAPGLLVPMMLFGAGAGCSILPLNLTVLTGVAVQDTGAASAMLQTMQWVGGSVGLAVLVTAFGAADRSGLAGASHAAFVHGVATAFVVGAALAGAALLGAVFVIRAPRRTVTEKAVTAKAQ